MKINCLYSELVELHKLVPHTRNANFHPGRQVELLAKIIDHVGQRHPIIVSKRSGFIVAGHGRLQAIQKLGWEKAAVEYQDFTTEADEYSFLIADNKIAELAEHDDMKMIGGAQELGIEDFELLGLDNFHLELEADELPIDDQGLSDDKMNEVRFILSNEQRDFLEEALKKATENEDCTDEINPNHQGNALAAILKRYIHG